MYAGQCMEFRSPFDPLFFGVHWYYFVPTYLSSQVLCIRITMRTVAGANHPRASNTQEISDNSNLLVTSASCLSSDMDRVNASVRVFHIIPRVLAMPFPSSEIDSTSSVSLSSWGIDCRTWTSLEFHLRSWRQVLPNSLCIWSRSLMLVPCLRPSRIERFQYSLKCS